jgi:large subunit ribosomal protein L29
MKVKDIREKKNEELLKLLNESYDQLRDLRFQASVRKLKNHQSIPQTKKTIARILTILIERANLPTNEQVEEKN